MIASSIVNVDIHAVVAESFPNSDFEEASLKLNEAIQVQSPYTLFISVIAKGDRDRSSFKINYQYIEIDPNSLTENEKNLQQKLIL